MFTQISLIPKRPKELYILPMHDQSMVMGVEVALSVEWGLVEVDLQVSGMLKQGRMLWRVRLQGPAQGSVSKVQQVLVGYLL